MTKAELLKKFAHISVVPPEGATRDELERTWHETIRNIHSSGHPSVEKLSKQDVEKAQRLEQEAASYDQAIVDVGGTG